MGTSVVVVVVDEEILAITIGSEEVTGVEVGTKTGTSITRDGELDEAPETSTGAERGVGGSIKTVVGRVTGRVGTGTGFGTIGGS